MYTPCTFFSNLMFTLAVSDWQIDQTIFYKNKVWKFALQKCSKILTPRANWFTNKFFAFLILFQKNQNCSEKINKFVSSIRFVNPSKSGILLTFCQKLLVGIISFSFWSSSKVSFERFGWIFDFLDLFRLWPWVNYAPAIIRALVITW